VTRCACGIGLAWKIARTTPTRSVAYRGKALHAELFKFSLGANTSNESKTLQPPGDRRSTKINDKKRRDDLRQCWFRRRESSIFIGVGTAFCDFKRGCDGTLANSVAVVVAWMRSLRTRRKAYEETATLPTSPTSIRFQIELRKYGRDTRDPQKTTIWKTRSKKGTSSAGTSAYLRP